jgi:AraC family transcriptional regulator
MAPCRPDRVAGEELDRILFANARVTVGSFRCSPQDGRFHDSGPIQNDIVVFPRTSVRIRHEGDRPFVADPSLATIYNRGQRYTREAVAPEGDRCTWLAVERGIALEIARRVDPEAAEAPERPFRFPFGPTPASLCLAERLLTARLRSGEAVEELEVEEEVLSLAEAVLTEARARFDRPCAAPASAAFESARDLAERARGELAAHFAESLPLGELARRLGSSPFHLARSFRRVTGTTLHAHQIQLRLRAAVERLARPGIDLTGLALDLGFSSHSHFTAAFRRAFGAPPAALRGRLARDLRQAPGSSGQPTAAP